MFKSIPEYATSDPTATHFLQICFATISESKVVEVGLIG